MNPLHVSPIARVTMISFNTSFASLGEGHSAFASFAAAAPRPSSLRSGTIFSTTSPIPNTSEYDASPILRNAGRARGPSCATARMSTPSCDVCTIWSNGNISMNAENSCGDAWPHSCSNGFR